jgi:hypothetical protein
MCHVYFFSQRQLAEQRTEAESKNNQYLDDNLVCETEAPNHKKQIVVHIPTMQCTTADKEDVISVDTLLMPLEPTTEIIDHATPLNECEDIVEFDEEAREMRRLNHAEIRALIEPLLPLEVRARSRYRGRRGTSNVTTIVKTTEDHPADQQHVTLLNVSTVESGKNNTKRSAYNKEKKQTSNLEKSHKTSL